jgi:hypothetical protein
MSTSPAWLDDAQKVTGAARQQRRRDGRRVFLVMMDARIGLMMTLENLQGPWPGDGNQPYHFSPDHWPNPV